MTVPSSLPIPTKPITDADEANAALRAIYKCAADSECIVARGRVRIPSIMPGFALVFHRMLPGPDDIIDMGRGTSVYKSRYIRQIAESAGLSVSETRRCDGGTDPWLREVEVTLTGYDLLTRARQWRGRYEADFRDGSARLAGLPDGMVKGKRQHILSLAETGAYCRAVVAALAIPRGFQDGNNADIFMIIPSIEIHLASAPEAVQQAITLQALGAVMGAYGAPAPALPPPAPSPAPVLPPPIDDEIPEPEFDEIPFDEDGMLPDEDPEDVLDIHAPAENPNRPITQAEHKKLNDLGCYRQTTLKAHGWDSNPGPDGRRKPITLATFNSILAQYGGNNS